MRGAWSGTSIRCHRTIRSRRILAAPTRLFNSLPEPAVSTSCGFCPTLTRDGAAVWRPEGRAEKSHEWVGQLFRDLSGADFRVMPNYRPAQTRLLQRWSAVLDRPRQARPRSGGRRSIVRHVGSWQRPRGSAEFESAPAFRDAATIAFRPWKHATWNAESSPTLESQGAQAASSRRTVGVALLRREHELVSIQHNMAHCLGVLKPEKAGAADRGVMETTEITRLGAFVLFSR
jgi:hypothetical protein